MFLTSDKRNEIFRKVNLLINEYQVLNIFVTIHFNMTTIHDHLLKSKTISQSKAVCNFFHIARMASDNSKFYQVLGKRRSIQYAVIYIDKHPHYVRVLVASGDGNLMLFIAQWVIFRMFLSIYLHINAKP